MDPAAGRWFRTAETILTVDFRRTSNVFRVIFSWGRDLFSLTNGHRKYLKARRRLEILFPELRRASGLLTGVPRNNGIFFCKISIFLLDKVFLPVYTTSTNVLLLSRM